MYDTYTDVYTYLLLMTGNEATAPDLRSSTVTSSFASGTATRKRPSRMNRRTRRTRTRSRSRSRTPFLTFVPDLELTQEPQTLATAKLQGPRWPS